MEKLLEELGLTKNQVKIYLGFLRFGEQTAAALAKKLSMDKSSTYRASEELEKMSLLISSPKKRGKTYEAVTPDILRELIDTKKQKLEQNTRLLDSFIENMKKQSRTQYQTFIKVEKGIEALQFAFIKMLSCKEKIIREKFTSSHPDLQNEMHVKFIYDFAKQRIKKGILMRELNYKGDHDIYNPIEHTSKELLKEMHVLPEEIDKNTSFSIYDETIILVTTSPTNEILTITIKDKFVANLMKNVYDFIWKHSKLYKHHNENK